MFSFQDKWIWIGSGKFSVLWWECLAPGNNGSTYGPETKDLTKDHAFQLYLWHNVEKVE